MPEEKLETLEDIATAIKAGAPAQKKKKKKKRKRKEKHMLRDFLRKRTKSINEMIEGL